MIGETIREFAAKQRTVRVYAEEYQKLEMAVAGDLAGLHFKSREGWSGPEEYLAIQKRAMYQKLVQAQSRFKPIREQVKKELLEIPDEKLRKIIWHRFYYCRSWEEIGRIVHLSPAATKMKYHRYAKKQEAKTIQQIKKIRDATE